MTRAFRYPSAGAAAGAAAAQREYQLALTNTNEGVGNVVGEISEMDKYDNAVNVANALRVMAGSMNNLSISKVNALISLINELEGYGAHGDN